MVVTGLTWYYLMMSSVSAVTNIIIFSVLFSNFLRRKTLGTFLLSMSFIVTAIGETLFSLCFWFQAFSGIAPETIGVIYLAGMAILAMNTYFYYYFANRHILKDNDILKSIISLSFGVIVGIGFGIGLKEIVQNDPNAIFHFNITLAVADLKMYIFGLIFVLLLVPISVFLVFGRIVYRAIIIQRRSKDIIVKKGIQYTWVASIFHIIGAFTRTIIYVIKPIYQIPALGAVVFAFGVITTVLALTLYGLGWVMPDWLKRRFRKKSWFTKIYIGKISEPKIAPPTPVKNIETSSQNFVEVSEK